MPILKIRIPYWGEGHPSRRVQFSIKDVKIEAQIRNCVTNKLEGIYVHCWRGSKSFSEEILNVSPKCEVSMMQLCIRQKTKQPTKQTKIAA